MAKENGPLCRSIVWPVSLFVTVTVAAAGNRRCLSELRSVDSQHAGHHGAQPGAGGDTEQHDKAAEADGAHHARTRHGRPAHVVHDARGVVLHQQAFVAQVLDLEREVDERSAGRAGAGHLASRCHPRGLRGLRRATRRWTR